MPKNYASGVRLIKRKNNKFKKVVMLGVIVAFCMLFGEVFANIIRYGSLSITASSSTKNYTLYALSMGECDTYDDALQLANNCVVRGAGGYIYHQDKYYVLAQIYPKEADAQNVAQSITEYKCNVLPLKFPKKDINKDMDGAATQKVKNSLEFLKTLYSSLYDNCIKLDTKEFGNIAFCNNVNYFKSQAKSIVVELMQVNSTINSNKIGDIVNAYIAIIDSLDSCMNKMLQAESGGSIAKYMLCEVGVLSYNVINKI